MEQTADQYSIPLRNVVGMHDGRMPGGSSRVTPPRRDSEWRQQVRPRLTASKHLALLENFWSRSRIVRAHCPGDSEFRNTCRLLPGFCTLSLSLTAAIATCKCPWQCRLCLGKSVLSSSEGPMTHIVCIGNAQKFLTSITRDHMSAVSARIDKLLRPT